MNPLVIAAGFGIAGALIVYALRGAFQRRYDRDVAWMQHTLWRFNPNPKAAEPYVVGYYCLALALLGVLLLLASSAVLALLIWSLVFFVPRWFADYQWGKRKETINDQLPGAVRKLSSSVASGLSLAQAMERLAVRAPDPIRTEFYVISNYWKMGADFESAIEDAKRRLKLQNFTLFASAVVVNQHMGGNVVLTLDRLATSLESIASMQREVRSATAEGRMNVKVLAIAPFGMLGMVSFMDAGAVAMLFNTVIGQFILAFAIGLTALGTWWAWKIVNSDV